MSTSGLSVPQGTTSQPLPVPKKKRGIRTPFWTEWPTDDNLRITVLGCNTTVLSVTCGNSAEEIEALLNKRLKVSAQPELKGKEVGSVTLLRNKDVVLYAAYDDEAETFRQLESSWVSILGRQASIRIYRVQVSGILRKDVQEMTPEDLLGEFKANDPEFFGRVMVKSATWATVTVPRSSPDLGNMKALVNIEFYHPAQANEAINRGILWQTKRKACRRPPPGEPFPQCTTCFKLGHLAEECLSKQVCDQCGSHHRPDVCSNELKCVNCGGRHCSSSEQCSERKKATNGWVAPLYRTDMRILDGPSTVMEQQLFLDA